MKIRINKMGINGEGIGYFNRLPVFIEGVLKDELVEAKITERHGNYAKAECIKIIEKSRDRIKPVCQYYGKCGGCQLLHMGYYGQLEYKYETLAESLEKYAGIDGEMVEDVRPNPNPLGYRNSLKLPVFEQHHKLVCGLYETNSNHMIEVDQCAIHEDGLERVKKNVLNVLNKYHYHAYDKQTKKGIKGIFLRVLDNHFQLCLVTGETRILKETIDDLGKIQNLVSIYQSIHTTKSHEFFGKQMIHLYGSKYLIFKLGDLKLNLSTRSFFQLNTAQAQNLYQFVVDNVKDNQDFIFEAYSGIGAISLMLKDKAHRIMGVESIADAVANANMNARNNHIDHVHFVCDDAAVALKHYSKKHKIDTLVVDPPRVGLDDNMLETILRSKIDDIIYISCNPATLAKNLAVLSQRYQVTRIVPFDIFSQSAHVETVCVLTKKNSNHKTKPQA